MRRAGSRAIKGPRDAPITPAIPEGYEAVQITTGPKGGQSIKARPAPAEDAHEPIPHWFDPVRISALTRGDGGLVQRWDIYEPNERKKASMLDRLREGMDEIPRAAPTPPPGPGPMSDDHFTMYPLGDPHIGVRGYKGEGLREGVQMLVDAMADLVRRGRRTRECMILNLGDFYHSDDPSNRTRRGGYPLDVDGEWFEILKAGRDAFFALIDAALEHHEIVHVRCLIGNHDDLSSLFLTLLVEARYQDEPRVRIDTSGAPFQWFEWGKNLWGFTHGQTAKVSKLPQKMANEKPEAWGRTTHRYWLCGHVHHTRKVEVGGLLIESFRTLAPRDAHHEAAGYLAGRDLSRIVYRRKGGEVSRETVSAEMIWDR